MAINTEFLKQSASSNPIKKLNWTQILVWSLLFLFPLSLYLVWISPTDAELLYSQRIFYFHFPANIMCFVSFTVYFTAAIGYWRKRGRNWDIVMMASLELGLFFALIGILTGSIWARYAWNTWWTWDPRLTTVTIMMAVYLAGVMLRNATDEPSRKAALTAAFGIIGFVNVPLVYFSTRWFPRGLHPVIFGSNGNASNLQGFMNVTLAVSTITVGLLFTYLIIQRVKLEEMRDDVAVLQFAHQDED